VSIERSPLGEGPHVRLKVPRRTAVAGGRAAFRLTCPRALQRACAGTLRLQLGRASSVGRGITGPKTTERPAAISAP
jgi:hypothetical protein